MAGSELEGGVYGVFSGEISKLKGIEIGDHVTHNFLPTLPFSKHFALIAVFHRASRSWMVADDRKMKWMMDNRLV